MKTVNTTNAYNAIYGQRISMQYIDDYEQLPVCLLSTFAKKQGEEMSSFIADALWARSHLA